MTPQTPPRKNEVDPIIHAPARLKIMAVLSAVKHSDFLFLLHQTGLTKGNLSAHLSKLERAEYVLIQKEFGRHYHPRRAKPTLHSPIIDECLLERVQLGPRRQAFYSKNILIPDRNGQCRAGEYGFTINQNST